MKLSIITINYNNKNGLLRTIESVNAQIVMSNDSFEHIIVDGGSEDGFERSLTYFSGVLISEKDKGISDAFNKGIDLAKGEYILMLNSGDIFAGKNVVQDFFTIIDNSPVDILFGNVHLDGEHPNIVVGKKIIANIVADNIPHQGAFVKRKLCAEHKYSLNYKLRMDYDFFSRLLKAKNIDVKYHDFNVSLYEAGGLSMKEKNRFRFYLEAFMIDLRDMNSSMLSNLIRSVFHYLKGNK